jgi:hypothetical protein
MSHFDWMSFILGAISSAVILSAISWWQKISRGDVVEQFQRHRVMELKNGDRVRVRDEVGDQRREPDEKIVGTISRVDKNGESFDVKWDDGHTNTLWYFDWELLERVK